MRAMKPKLSLEEKAAKVRLIDSYHKQGLSFEEACEKADVNKSTYYFWKNPGIEKTYPSRQKATAKKVRKKPVHHDFVVPMAPAEKMVMVFLAQEDQVVRIMRKVQNEIA